MVKAFARGYRPQPEISVDSAWFILSRSYSGIQVQFRNSTKAKTVCNRLRFDASLTTESLEWHGRPARESRARCACHTKLTHCPLPTLTHSPVAILIEWRRCLPNPRRCIPKPSKQTIIGNHSLARPSAFTNCLS